VPLYLKEMNDETVMFKLNAAKPLVDQQRTKPTTMSRRQSKLWAQRPSIKINPENEYTSKFWGNSQGKIGTFG